MLILEVLRLRLEQIYGFEISRLSYSGFITFRGKLYFKNQNTLKPSEHQRQFFGIAWVITQNSILRYGEKNIFSCFAIVFGN